MPGLFTILSPAKTLDMSGGEGLSFEASRPRHSAKTSVLAKELEGYSSNKLEKLMSISTKLAKENSDRWEVFGERSNPRGAAAMCFRGDVYQGLEAWTMKKPALSWAQDRVRILSGLYGLLRPLDTIQPYRLEMGTRLKTNEGTNLYEFWGRSILKTLIADMKDVGAKTLINLASDEYSKSACISELDARVVDVKFLQVDGGKSKFISFYAKRARGLMARWMADHRPRSLTDLNGFDTEGYRIDTQASEDSLLVFSRPKPAAAKRNAS